MISKHESTVEGRTEVVDFHQEIVEETQVRRRLTRKLDFILLPTIFLLDMFSLLERSNIGNARIQGLEKDLHVDPDSNRFNILLSCFWATYIPAAVVSNVVMQKFAPSSYLSCLSILSGGLNIATLSLPG